MLVKPRKLTKEEIQQREDIDLFIDWVTQNLWAFNYFSSHGRLIYIDQFSGEVRLEFEDGEAIVSVPYDPSVIAELFIEE